MASKVLLLRAPDEQTDRYHTCFQSAPPEILVESIPVLEFEFCNELELLNCIQNYHKYGGIIFTSARAVEAFHNCFTGSNSSLKSSVLPSIKEAWTVFVIGKGSSRLLKELKLTCHGENCGNAEELAQYISSFVDSTDSAAGSPNGERLTITGIPDGTETRKPYIFPCGNLARETIPICLTKDNIPYQQLCVYETKPNCDFQTKMNNYLESCGFPNILVFFSPSGADFFLTFLSQMLNNFKDVKVVAIGKTTAAALHKSGCRCDGITAKPTPESLLEAILRLI